VFSELLSKTMRVLEVTRADGRRTTLKRSIYDTIHAPVADKELGSLIFAVSVTRFVFLAVWVMWKRHWMLKV
jgi:hypothetical protein